MTVYAYLFESKAIQSFILDSGKLRDLIGASELVDSLTEELLPVALRALQYQDEDPIRFSRRAGGALYAFADDKDALDRFAALWSLLVAQYAPGLNFDVGQADGDDAGRAFAKAHQALREDASRVRQALPVTAPITARSRRTGNPGVDREKEAVIDLPTKRKKAFANLAKSGPKSGLTGRFSPDDANLRWRDWPRDLTPGEDGAFPFLGDDHTVALIHADGNGMGVLLRHAAKQAEGKPDEEYISIFRDLSETIAEVTQTAAKCATETVLMPERETRRDPRQPDTEVVLAARPIVLGGDDLTILVRADLALPFLRTFLEKFEDESEKQLPDQMIGAKRLTAGAGVVFLRASQPFYLATSLAESLAKLAKDHAKAMERHNPPSTLAFHRVTQSMIEDYPQIVEREKTILVDDVTYINTLGAYALRPGQRLPCLDDLVQLQILLQHEVMSRGPTRQLQTLMGLAPNQAETAYRRWRELMQENKAERLEEYHARMSALTDDYVRNSALPYAHSKSTKNDRSYHSPIGDVLTLMAVKSAVPERTNGKPGESAA